MLRYSCRNAFTGPFPISHSKLS